MLPSLWHSGTVLPVQYTAETLLFTATEKQQNMVKWHVVWTYLNPWSRLQNQLITINYNYDYTTARKLKKQTSKRVACRTRSISLQYAYENLGCVIRGQGVIGDVEVRDMSGVMCSSCEETPLRQDTSLQLEKLHLV